MAYEYLNDKIFLSLLDTMKIRVQYAKIILLDFEEKPIRAIEGNITTGSLSVNGNSAIRRTISLTMLASPKNSNVTNLENEISINKKIRVEVGFKNPFPAYKHYGDIIWFKCGLFVLSQANVTRSTGAFTIAIQGKDKMVMLDGSVGGTLPAAVAFHEQLEYPSDEWDKPERERNQIIIHPTIYQIIFEAVNHFGKESASNIIINDLPKTAKLLIKYIGDDPIYFNNEYSDFSYTRKNNYVNKYVAGQDVGYQQTDFTYPGELNLKAGESVVSLLNKITQTLGNFEFFYNIDGKFVFQEKRNYLNNSNTGLLDLSLEDYVQVYNDTVQKYNFTDMETVTSISKNPKIDNIKNDFIVWGQRTTVNGAKIDIWYHLAIDQKPKRDFVDKYIIKVQKSNKEWVYQSSVTKPTKGEIVATPLSNQDIDFNWREELYRRALVANSEGRSASDYDQELLAYWRTIFDPYNNNWKNTNGWDPVVKNDPRQLNYWLDFIDGSEAIDKYSVNVIGRRTKAVNDTKIKAIFNTEVPDVIFYSSGEEKPENENGFQLDAWNEKLFVASSTGTSAFDKMRELLYQHLNYNTSITIQTIPKYYMEPNNIIYVNDQKSNVIGNYFISQFSLPLTYSGTMSITATEVLNRI